MVARGRSDDGCEFGMYRNHELGTALLLLHMNGTTAHVLRPHADNVAAALAGVEPQCVRQPGARTYGMATLESRNLVVRPAMMSPGLDPNCFYVAGGSSPEEINDCAGKHLDLQIGPRRLAFTSETFI